MGIDTNDGAAIGIESMHEIWMLLKYLIILPNKVRTNLTSHTQETIHQNEEKIGFYKHKYLQEEIWNRKYVRTWTAFTVTGGGYGLAIFILSDI